MPLIYERPFRIRHYECDAQGQFKHANYARFMQEVALDASASVGYDIARYEAMNRLWLIRETNLYLQRPLTFDQTVIVKTWVEDFRRVRSRRAYHFQLADTNENVAKAHTDWIFIDTHRERPVTVPPEMIAAFMPEDLREQAPRREKFPKPPQPPQTVCQMTCRVPWHDIDGAGHVNNAMYLAYIEECTVRASAQSGWPPSRFQEIGQAFHATHYRIEYLQPAFFDDEIEVTTYLSDVEGATAVRHINLTRLSDNALLARAQVQFLWTDLASGTPTTVPANYLADLAPNLV